MCCLSLCCRTTGGGFKGQTTAVVDEAGQLLPTTDAGLGVMMGVVSDAAVVGGAPMAQEVNDVKELNTPSTAAAALANGTSPCAANGAMHFLFLFLFLFFTFYLN